MRFEKPRAIANGNFRDLPSVSAGLGGYSHSSPEVLDAAHASASDDAAPGQLRDIAGNPYGSAIVGGNGQMPRRLGNGLQAGKPGKMIQVRSCSLVIGDAGGMLASAIAPTTWCPRWRPLEKRRCCLAWGMERREPRVGAAF
jgi:hypothetical protein